MCSIVVLSVGLMCSVVVLSGGSHVLGSCVVGWVSRAR